MSGTLSPLFTWRSAIAGSDLRPTATLVAFTLSLHMNELGGSCFPSIPTLAKECSLTDRAVQKALRTLADAGWIQVEVGGGRKSNHYTATLPDGFSTPVNVVHPPPPEGVQEVHRRGERGSPEGVIEDVKEKGYDFNCPECGLRFKGPRTLGAHRKNVHDIEEGVPA